jgi:type II secretory pathway component PulM
MDVARTPPKKTRRNLLIGGGVLALVVITAWTLTLDPASQTIERSAVLIDSVR